MNKIKEKSMKKINLIGYCVKDKSGKFCQIKNDSLFVIKTEVMLKKRKKEEKRSIFLFFRPRYIKRKNIAAAKII